MKVFDVAAIQDILKSLVRGRVGALNLSVNVRIQHFDADGNLIDEELQHNIITDAGCAHVADQLASSHDESEMNHMAVGTDDTAEAADDTALGSESDRQALSSRTQGSGGDDHKVTYSASFTGLTDTLTEAGIFNDASVGTMLARVTYGAKTMEADETIQFDWTLTAADDGS